MRKLLNEEDIKLKPFPLFKNTLSSIDEEALEENASGRVNLSPRSIFPDQGEMLRFAKPESM
jgi:hypothetical protein